MSVPEIAFFVLGFFALVAIAIVTSRPPDGEQ